MYNVRTNSTTTTAQSFEEITQLAISTSDYVYSKDENTGDAFETEQPLYVLYNSDGFFMDCYSTFEKAIDSAISKGAAKVVLETKTHRLTSDERLYAETVHVYKSVVME